jgi:hypothetical protein
MLGGTMGGIFVGIVFGLINKTWGMLIGSSIVFDIVCGGWVAVRGLDSRDQASYLKVAEREGRPMPSRGLAAIIEAFWQTIFCFVAGSATKGIIAFFT